ncbi:MAG: hypothetical protein OXN89_18170 [Bryobacterales bacterium]|nr:hypothetical protein [Bryobacterales bacterium]
MRGTGSCRHWSDRERSLGYPSITRPTADGGCRQKDRQGRLQFLSGLGSHDWGTSDGTPWNESHVRNPLDDPSSTGRWNVRVVEAGDYDVRLRGWPAESDTPIYAPFPAGGDLPGDSPFHASPGKVVQAVKARVRVGEVRAEAPAESRAKQITIRMLLGPGKARMSALFSTRDGGAVDAFYAYFRRF